MGHSDWQESSLQCGAFRPVIIKKGAIGIEQEPLVALHPTLIKIWRGAAKPQAFGSRSLIRDTSRAAFALQILMEMLKLCYGDIGNSARLFHLGN